MRALGFAAAAVAHVLLAASPAVLATAVAVENREALPQTLGPVIRGRDEFVDVVRRDGMHGHGGHGHAAPKTEINETEILFWHAPTPPSYGTHDFEDADVTRSYPALMGLHVICMSAAFFIALPVGIALRAVRHALHPFSTLAFYVLVFFGVSSSALYRKLTPNLYEGNKHGSQGYIVLFIASTLTVVDGLSTMTRAFQYFRSVYLGDRKFAIKSLWTDVVLGRNGEETDYGVALPHEYTTLNAEPEEMDLQELKAANVHSNDVRPEDPALHTAEWASNVRAMHQEHRQRGSIWRDSIQSIDSPTRHSDETLHDLSSIRRSSGDEQPALTRSARLRQIGSIVFATIERVLVFLGYMQLLTGIVDYTGICRDSYVNGCLAHLIKGGIFWCYGLVTFARFLGSFAELGWAWNRPPSGSPVTAEFVESAVIFSYGITNTWMERFGVAPGTPFSTKEMQHISIAIMFWFAGLVGMGIESKRIRRWLAAAVTAAATSATGRSGRPASPSEVTAPPSYSGSFNPFPALVIGVTGAAMSAHMQVYLFQVQIHALWGFLLVGFSVLRCLTYLFLWLGPPSSILPSRPPTEALASFFLACGGLMFQFSTEEITLAALRRGHDDQMMFLNVVIAMTCLAFCWTLAIVAFKGWLKSRAQPSSVHIS